MIIASDTAIGETPLVSRRMVTTFDLEQYNENLVCLAHMTDFELRKISKALPLAISNLIVGSSFKQHLCPPSDAPSRRLSDDRCVQNSAVFAHKYY